MFGAILRHASNAHPAKPLVVRAGLPRTFGSLVCFLAGMFLCLGIYILEDLFAHPVDAQDAALLAAAFVIALAILLLFYLFKPRRSLRTAGPPAPHNSTAFTKRPLLLKTPRIVQRDELRKDLAYQRIYVDHSLIQP